VTADARRNHTQAFPDALTFTLPIWAAVLNRYVGPAAAAEAGPDLVYLPPWVPPSERDRIVARLPDLCAKLEEALGPDAAFREELLAAFQAGGSPTPKSFRPVWVKHGDPLWLLPGVAVGEDDSSESSSSSLRPALDFIPIVCVSASRDREPEEHREHFR